MDVTVARNVMNSLMVISSCIFAASVSIMIATHTGFAVRAVCLSFAFLFIAMMTFITTSKMNEEPALAGRVLRQWVLICVFAVALSALVYAIA